MLLLETLGSPIKGISIEIHLDVLRIHIAHHLWEVWEDAIKIGNVLHVKIYICSIRHTLTLKLISSESKMETLLLTVPTLHSIWELRVIWLMMLVIEPSLLATYLY